MAIMRYSPPTPTYSVWRDIDAVSNRLSRLFDEAPSKRGATWSPTVSVSETKEELILTAELPGLAEEEIHLELENDVITISGEKIEERTEDDEERRYHLWERSYGSFRRSFTLPRAVSGSEVSAVFDNGVLTVRLPKVAEAKGRTIEISKN